MFIEAGSQTSWSKRRPGGKRPSDPPHRRRAGKSAEQVSAQTNKGRANQAFNGKCAYCEGKINHVAYPHIEHFRPIIPQYYELAVDWDNLLLACGRCNGAENKGVKFPTETENGPLVNPTEEDPAGNLCFDFDPMTKLANVLGISHRGETTRIVLGLNRPDLVRHRSDFVKKLWVIGSRYHHDHAAREIIDEAVSDNSEYAAFARALKRIIEEHQS